MMHIQIQVLSLWWQAGDSIRRRLAEPDNRDSGGPGDRGEVNSAVVLIVILVAATLIAGAIIAGKITANANNVPDP